jgi:hypothetical protein
MHQVLRLHPDSRCAAVRSIEVEIVQPSAGKLSLSYRVTGNISDIRFPSVTTPTRTDELWRHTCFEAFLRASSGAAYYEFNFAPSTQWAAYRFDAYRSGMRVAGETSAPRIEVRSDGACYELHAALELDRMTSLPSDMDWRLGLSAVIEEANGNTSYWALVHPPGKPDFHHDDSFACNLAGTDRP